MAEGAALAFGRLSADAGQLGAGQLAEDAAAAEAVAQHHLPRAGGGHTADAGRALPAGGFSLVVSNPPYFVPGRGAAGGPARTEGACGLEDWCAAAGRLVKNGGRFALVHRPERLADLFAALRGAGLEPKRLRLVQHGPDASPSAALVEAVRQGRPGLEVLPALLLTGR